MLAVCRGDADWPGLGIRKVFSQLGRRGEGAGKSLQNEPVPFFGMPHRIKFEAVKGREEESGNGP